MEFADLRIAVVSPFVDRRHGTERALAELLERLVRDYQCEVHLYSQRVTDLSLKTRSKDSAEEKAGIFWHKVPRVPGPHIIQFCFWFYWNRWQRKIFGGKFDLVISPGINCSDADVVIVHALFSRLQDISRNDSSDENAGFLRSLHRKAYYSLLTKLERRIYGEATKALAAVSQRTAILISQYFQRNDVRIIPNGVDSEAFSLALRLQRREKSRKRRNYSDEEFVLLLIGNDWKNKGLPAVLQALGGLQTKSLRLLVVGDDAQEYFRKLSHELGIAQLCTWETGSDDVMEFYAAADLYVSPSREDSFGLPVAEAMSCGLPVITSGYAGVSSLVHDGVDGFVLREPDDVESLTKLIRMLSEHGELRMRIGMAASETMKAWTWDRNAAEIWKIITSVAEQKNNEIK